MSCGLAICTENQLLVVFHCQVAESQRSLESKVHKDKDKRGPTDSNHHQWSQDLALHGPAAFGMDPDLPTAELRETVLGMKDKVATGAGIKH